MSGRTARQAGRAAACGGSGRPTGGRGPGAPARSAWQRRPFRGSGTPAAPPGAGPAARVGLRARWALLAALAGGVALAGAFPPAGVWPLAAAGSALLVVALWRRSLRGSFAVGLVFGLAFFAVLVSWLVNVAWYVWAALVVAEALMFAALTVAQRPLLGLRAWPVAVAGWWVAAEALRGRWPYPFPWGRLAMSQAGAPTAGWAVAGGAPLLTFVVALAGAALAWPVLAPPRRGEGRGGVPGARLGPALAFAGAAGLALAGAALPAGQGGPGDRSVVVAAVQGGVSHARSLPRQLRAAAVTADQAAATEQLAAQAWAGVRPVPDVVIWPENSADLDPGRHRLVYRAIAAAVDAIGRPVLVGAVLQDPLRNTGQLWLPARGPAATYVKRQLVPFGEYIPFRGLLSRVTSLVALQPHDFTAGHHAVVFGAGRIRLGDVICYEAGFDGLVSSEVTAGANLLAVQSNDASFEVDRQAGESLQQLAMARIRAVESDRAVVYAATTGVSAIIAPDGSVLARSGIWARAVLEARVPLRTQITLTGRAGQWPQAAITTLTVAALAAAIVRARRSTSAPP